MKKEIIGVAVKLGDVTICLPKPNRHYDCIRYAAETLGLHPPISAPEDSHGFYLVDGTYLTRKEALVYANKIFQKIKRDAKVYLFSEDLW